MASTIWSTPSSFTRRSSNQELMSCYDLAEGALRNVVFEGVVLSRYGTFDRIESAAGSSTSPNVRHVIINNDLLDRQGLATITVVCYNKQLCRQYSAVLTVGKHLRISTFTMKDKTGLGVEKGDIPRCIQIGMGTTVEIIPPFVPKVIPQFVASDTVASFKKEIYKKYITTSLAVAVIDICAESDRLLTLKVADGINEEDVFIFQLELDQRPLYESICRKFVAKKMPLLFLKNVAANTYREKSLKAEKFTIVTEVGHELTKQKLEQVFKTLVPGNLATKTVEGLLTVPFPAAPHFKIICPKCGLCNFIRHPSDRIFCNECNALVKAKKIPNVPIKIMLNEEGETMTSLATRTWLEQVLAMRLSIFMALPDIERIILLSSIHFFARFNITAANQITGHELLENVTTDQALHIEGLEQDTGNDEMQEGNNNKETFVAEPSHGNEMEDYVQTLGEDLRESSSDFQDEVQEVSPQEIASAEENQKLKKVFLKRNLNKEHTESPQPGQKKKLKRRLIDLDD